MDMYEYTLGDDTYCTVLLENDLAVDERDETFVDASLVTVGSDEVGDFSETN